MFHKSDLGIFGESLPCDRDGYVPEGGDTQDKFDFGGDDFTDDEWEEFVEKAIEATEAADAAATRWRERN